MIFNRERTFCTQNIEGICQLKTCMSVLLLIFTESIDTTSPFFTAKISSTKNPFPIEIGCTYTMSLQREIQKLRKTVTTIGMESQNIASNPIFYRHMAKFPFIT